MCDPSEGVCLKGKKGIGNSVCPLSMCMSACRRAHVHVRMHSLTHIYIIIRDLDNACSYLARTLYITLRCRHRVQLVPSVHPAPLEEKERRVSKEEMQGQAQPVNRDGRSVPCEI